MINKSIASVVVALSCILGVSHAQAFSDDELTIWIGGDKSYNALQVLGKQFEKEMGIKVNVEMPESLPDRFQQAASTGKGPDVVLWAHDRFGEWALSGLLATVEPSEQMKDEIEAIGWQATSYNNKIYGYPLAMEAISLIYNKDLLPKPPTSFEDMFVIHKEMKARNVTTILWDQANPYFTVPLLLANGGYIYREGPAGYDTKDVGVNNEGALIGAKMLTRLIDDGVMPRGSDYAVMDANFNQGQAAMMISGPWAWANLDKSGINYGIAPLPSIDGKNARAMVGVWAAAINNATPNKVVAQEFIENYLLTENGLKTMNADKPLGAVPHKGYMKVLAADPRIAVTYQNAVNGMLMPNIPEMGKFWSAITTALQNITTNQQSEKSALDNAARLMKI